MELDNIRHEITMVKGGLDELVQLLDKNERNTIICIVESLSMRLQKPLDSLESFCSISSMMPGVERAEQLNVFSDIS